jgi:hypothetical protein
MPLRVEARAWSNHGDHNFNMGSGAGQLGVFNPQMNRFGTRTPMADHSFIEYRRGPLTVQIPFEFQIRRGDLPPTAHNLETWQSYGGGAAGTHNALSGNNSTLIQWRNAEIRASFRESNYQFFFGIENLLTNPRVRNAGGWYDFMDGQARLAVSFRNAVSTQWFRSSTVSLIGLGRYAWEDIAANISFNYPGGSIGTVTNPSGDPAPGTGDWPRHAHRADGIAYRFYIVPGTFSVGVSFANYSMFAPLTNTTGLGNPGTGGGNYSAISDFILNGVFGAKFEADVWEVAAMLGWSNYWSDPNNPPSYLRRSYIPPSGTISGGDPVFSGASVPVYVGATYRIPEAEVAIGADMSARFLQTGPDGLAAPGVRPYEEVPIFNLGAYLAYGNRETLGGFWARLEMFALELGLPLVDENNDPVQRPVNYGGLRRTIGLEVSAAFNRRWEVRSGPNGPDAPRWHNTLGTGFWAGAQARFNNFLNFEEEGVTFNLGIGYRDFGLGIEQLVFSVAGFVQTIINEDTTALGFRVVPELRWNVIPRGNIRFEYVLGYNWNDDENNHGTGLRPNGFRADGTPITGTPGGPGPLDSTGSSIFNRGWRYNTLTNHQLNVIFTWNF